MKKDLYADVTEFLKENDLTYKWLARQLNLKGCEVNIISLSKWVHGNQLSKKAEEVHEVALKIVKLYCDKFAKKVSEV